MKKLLPNQNYFLDKLYREMQSGKTTFFISGNSGCGKTVSIQYVSEKFKESGYLSITLNGDPILAANEYFPFYSALSDTLPDCAVYGTNEVIRDYGENIPKFGKQITRILGLLTKKEEIHNEIRDLALGEKEQDIVCKIQYLAEHREVLFVCDNLNCWDEKSLKLLYIILKNQLGKYSFLSKCVFLLIHTNKTVEPNNPLIDAIKSLDTICKLEFPSIRFKDFHETLSVLGYKNNLSIKECQILYSLINGHMRMLVDLINELNRKKLTLDTIAGKPKEILSVILKQRLEECGATGEQIRITLEYASLLGLTFSPYELNQIMKLGNATFQNIITRSNEMNLIEEISEQKNLMQFAHDIIHEIFESAIPENGENYYTKIELCLKEIEPDQYNRRAQYASKAGEYEYMLTLTVLSIVKQIREENISIDELKDYRLILKENTYCSSYYNYILTMKKGYDLYREGKYNEALKEAIMIEDIYPTEFLAEKAILCSYCYTKNIDASHRNEGLMLLSNFSTLEKCNYERDIYERILIRMMILYVHLDDIDNAKNIEKKIINSLKCRINHDEAAQMRYYSLCRISNSIYCCELAVQKMKNAMDFFGTNYEGGGLWRDIKQYYLSQVNYAAALCLNGKFAESYERNLKALELHQKFPEYPFPRPNILFNNYLISGYLSQHLTISECIVAYEQFLSSLNMYADRLFYVSNYSIFCALSGKTEFAVEMLNKEGSLHNTNKDPEKIYNYRVALNTGVYYYLLGDKPKALGQLSQLKNQMDLMKLQNDTTYDYRRVKEIIDYISNSSKCMSPTKWENILLQNSSIFQSNAWNYYGKGYSFTTVFNWDL